MKQYLPRWLSIAILLVCAYLWQSLINSNRDKEIITQELHWVVKETCYAERQLRKEVQAKKPAQLDIMQGLYTEKAKILFKNDYMWSKENTEEIDKNIVITDWNIAKIERESLRIKSVIDNCDKVAK